MSQPATMHRIDVGPKPALDPASNEHAGSDSASVPSEVEQLRMKLLKLIIRNEAHRRSLEPEGT